MTTTPNTDALLPPECQGERCSMCGKQAWHKVGEEMFSSDPMPYRHNLTAYVCDGHFQQIMDRAGYTRTPPSVTPSMQEILVGIHNTMVDAASCAEGENDPAFSHFLRIEARLRDILRLLTERTAHPKQSLPS